MENKKMKKPIPVELDDDALDHVSGGTGQGYLTKCEWCGIFNVLVDPSIPGVNKICEDCKVMKISSVIILQQDEA